MKKFFKYGAWALGILIILLLIYGMANEPYRLAVEEETAPIRNLSPSWDGKMLAVVSDFQVGMWLDNISTIRQAINQAIEIHTSAVILVGDNIYHTRLDPDQELNTIRDLLAPLQQEDIPTFAVLGDHDYGKYSQGGQKSQRLANMVVDDLEQKGVRVLRNDAVPFSQDNQSEPLYLVGIGPENPNESHPVKALDEVRGCAHRLFPQSGHLPKPASLFRFHRPDRSYARRANPDSFHTGLEFSTFLCRR